MSATFTISKTKRFAAATVLFALLLCLFGCKSQEELLAGENLSGGYSFSYPESYSLLSEGSTTVLSAADVGGGIPYAVIRIEVFENEGGSAEEYWKDGIESFSAVYDSFEAGKGASFDFEGGTAYDANATATIVGYTNLEGQPSKADGKAIYTIRQLVFKKGGSVYTVTYMSAESYASQYIYAMDDIKGSFKAIEKAESTVTDKDMADFKVPVPEGWSLETSEAYYTLTKGKASITASVFSAQENKTAVDCWNNICVPDFEADFAGYELIKLNEEASLAGILAVDAEYKLTAASGNVYHFRQRIAVYNGDVYSVVLTADETDYKDCVKGYEAVVEGFLYK